MRPRSLDALNRQHATVMGDNAVNIHLLWARGLGGQHEKKLTKLPVLDVVRTLRLRSPRLPLPLIAEHRISVVASASEAGEDVCGLQRSTAAAPEAFDASSEATIARRSCEACGFALPRVDGRTAAKCEQWGLCAVVADWRGSPKGTLDKRRSRT